MDHTKTDLMAVDLKTRLPIGRVTLTDAIDTYTKMITGSYMSFEPASYLPVMQCLLNAIKPKTYVKKLYPEVENDWECYGIPELIVVDNGKEFHSLDFEDACLQIGTIVEYAPPQNPEYKGSKERYYRALNDQLLHNTPGTTFSNVLDKADYDPLKNAIIDVEDMKKIHHLFVIDIYPRQIHKGIRDVPARLWNEAIEMFPPALPLKDTDLRVLIGYIEYRTIRRDGIELFGLFYNCDALSILRRENKGQKVKIKYDPTDLSLIYVADSKNGLFIPVPAVDQEYTRGLTKYQHDVIRNYARKIAEDYVDSDALWRARKKIEEIVELAWDKSHKSSTRTRLARFKGIGLQNSWGAFEKVEVEQNEARSTIDTEQTVDQLQLNPALTKQIAGISNLEDALNSYNEENQLGEVAPRVPPASEEAEETIMPEQSSTNEQQRGAKRAMRDNAQARKVGATKIDSDISALSPLVNEADDISDDDETGDNDWGADYGQMEEEVLKWQKP